MTYNIRVIIKCGGTVVSDGILCDMNTANDKYFKSEGAALKFCNKFIKRFKKQYDVTLEIVESERSEL